MEKKKAIFGCNKTTRKIAQLPKRNVIGSLPLTIVPADKLTAGDVFLWQSEITGQYEIHAFHSDTGYGVKTFTDYDEKDSSSLILNWSGVRGLLSVANLHIEMDAAGLNG